MTQYRRRKDSDTWHWCKNCSQWPTSNYDTEYHYGSDRPSSGELDNECQSKEANDNCTT